METVRRLGIIAVAAALLAWLPGQAEAQETGVGVDAWGGIAFPASNLNEFQDIGPAFGLGLEYMLTDRVFVRGSGAAELFSGRDSGEMEPPTGAPLGLNAPDLTLFHYTAGIGAHLTPPDESNWDVSVSVEAGGTSVTTDDFPDAATPPGQFVGEEEDPTDEQDFSETYFTLSPGLRVGYLFADRYNLFVRSQPHFTFTETDRTEAFAQFDTQIDANGFDSVWYVPVTAGFQVNF